MPYLTQHEVKLLELLQTGCSAYSVNPQDALPLRSLQQKKLILIWDSSHWDEVGFDVTYQTYGCYPNYVEDGEQYRIID
jgi:hypothetical protein